MKDIVMEDGIIMRRERITFVISRGFGNNSNSIITIPDGLLICDITNNVPDKPLSKTQFCALAWTDAYKYFRFTDSHILDLTML